MELQGKAPAKVNSYEPCLHVYTSYDKWLLWYKDTTFLLLYSSGLVRLWSGRIRLKGWMRKWEGGARMGSKHRCAAAVCVAGYSSNDESYTEGTTWCERHLNAEHGETWHS
jgi:hypothetical protein